MQFIIELVIATKDNQRFSIAGYLKEDLGEMDLMAEMVGAITEYQKECSTGDYIVIKEGKILYVNIPIDVAATVISTLERNLSVNIITRLAKGASVSPKSIRPVVEMEISRLFG